MRVVAESTTQNRDRHMKSKNKYVGLDVHQDTTVVAGADGGRYVEVRLCGGISSGLGALEKVRRKLGGDAVTLHVVNAAGPTGPSRRLMRMEPPGGAASTLGMCCARSSRRIAVESAASSCGSSRMRFTSKGPKGLHRLKRRVTSDE